MSEVTNAAQRNSGHLSWWALPAWSLPAVLFVSLLAYAMWVEWCLTPRL